MTTLGVLVASLLILPSFVELDCGADGCDDDKELVQTFRVGCPATLSNVKCALRKKGEIEKWLNKNNDFRMLITGKTGSGKTTLVKGLKDRFVPEADHLEPQTLKVTPHKHEQDKVSYIWFDTPGLQDKEKGENDYLYLKNMVQDSTEPDVLIFTLKMDDNFRDEDIMAIEQISNAFGWRVWRNAIFVLTFANTIHKEGVAHQSRENHIYYNRVRDDVAQKVTDVLLKNKVQDDIANRIPVIPVGLVSQPFIESDGRQVSWIDEFWQAVSDVLTKLKRPLKFGTLLDDRAQATSEGGEKGEDKASEGDGSWFNKIFSYNNNDEL